MKWPYKSYPDGRMERRGILMFGYHNGDHRGHVSDTSGEVLGYWYLDDEEWAHFTPEGSSEVTNQAPSAWMLHDVIADLYGFE